MENLLPNPWLLGLGVTLLCYVVLQALKRLLISYQERKETQGKWGHIFIHCLIRTTGVFILGSSLYIAFQYIPHRKVFNFYVDRAWFVLLMLQMTIWGNVLVERWIHTVINRKTRVNKAAAGSISLLTLFSKFVLFSVIFLFTLNNLDIKITTFLAGLGVGGIAVGLALQKMLGDMFSSLSIVLDKPFVVGDFIIMDQYLGEVEKIGIRTTQIRSLSGEQITISNSDILNSRIRNYKRMFERRVVFVLSLTMDLSGDEIMKAVNIITSIVTSKERVRFDRCHLMAITRTSLDFETVYFVLSEDYNIYMDIQQSILVDIWKTFAAEKLRFAFPTQTINVTPTEVLMRHVPGPIPAGMDNKPISL